MWSGNNPQKRKQDLSREVNETTVPFHGYIGHFDCINLLHYYVSPPEHMFYNCLFNDEEIQMVSGGLHSRRLLVGAVKV